VSRVAAAAGPTPVPVASTVTEVVLPAAPDATISRGSDSSDVADDTPMVPGQSEHEAPPEPVGETPLTGSTSPLTALHPEGTTAEALRLSGDAPLQLSTTPAELPAAAGGPPASAPQVALQRRSDVEPAQPQTKPLSPDHPATGTASLPELPVVPEGPLLPAGSASLAPQPQLATPHLEKALAAPLQRRTATPPVLPPAAPLLGHREPLLQIPEKTVGPEPATTVQRLTFVLPPLASEEQGLSTPPPRRVLPSPVPTLRTGDARPASPPSPALVRAQVQRQREAASSLLPRQEGDAAPRSSGRTPPVAAQHFAPPPVVQRASAGPSAAEASPPADRPTVAASAPPSPGHAAGLASDQPEPESEGAIADLSYREPDDEVVAAGHILEPTLSLPPAGQPIALPRPDTLQRLTGDEIGPSAPAARDSVGFTASLDPRPMPPTPIVQRRSLPVTTPHRAGPAPEAITSSAAVPFASMFGGADPDPGDAGFTSVQLDTADGPVAGGAPTAPEASPTVQSVAAAAVPAPAPAASAGADLDEMARRLFEPLSARLRAELWLDRERAGLMSDARP
jgi:hypothetical protein